MRKIKLTYVLEIEVPAETLLTDGDVFIRGVQRMLGMNAERGWKATLRRLVGVTKGDGMEARHPRTAGPGPLHAVLRRGIH